jgi:alginate O-acetyltransferase complex protein AlgI
VRPLFLFAVFRGPFALIFSPAQRFVSRGGMLVQAISYCLLFLLCVLVLAKVRAQGMRQAVLLIASYVLYVTWGWWFAVVLLTSTIANFLFGQWLGRKTTGPILSFGILLNLLLLASFKYLPEAAVHIPLSSVQTFAHLAMPLGLSFWMFQAMSYLFDIYAPCRRHRKWRSLWEQRNSTELRDSR